MLLPGCIGPAQLHLVTTGAETGTRDRGGRLAGGLPDRRGLPVEAHAEHHDQRHGHDDQRQEPDDEMPNRAEMPESTHGGDYAIWP